MFVVDGSAKRDSRRARGRALGYSVPPSSPRPPPAPPPPAAPPMAPFRAPRPRGRVPGAQESAPGARSATPRELGLRSPTFGSREPPKNVGTGVGAAPLPGFPDVIRMLGGGGGQDGGGDRKGGCPSSLSPHTTQHTALPRRAHHHTHKQHTNHPNTHHTICDLFETKKKTRASLSSSSTEQTNFLNSVVRTPCMWSSATGGGCPWRSTRSRRA